MSVIINFVVLVSIISLALAVSRQKRWALVTVGVIGLVYLLIFEPDYISLVGVGVAALLFMYARQGGVEEMDQRIKINPRMIVQRSATSVVMALFLLVSFAAFQSPVAKGIAEAEQLPSATRQLMRSMVESTIGTQIEGGSVEKENIINQVSNETFKQINNILKPYFQYAPPLLAFGLFLILWGLSWIFVWLSVLVGMLMFWILKKVKFVKIEEKDSKIEILVVD